MKLPRMTVWLVVSIALVLLVYLTMPLDPQPSRWARFLVMVNKLNLVTLAGWLGYWLDRTAFPYARPDRFLPARFITDSILFAASVLRRALIIGACMLAVGLGA